MLSVVLAQHCDAIGIMPTTRCRPFRHPPASLKLTLTASDGASSPACHGGRCGWCSYTGRLQLHSGRPQKQLMQHPAFSNQLILLPDCLQHEITSFNTLRSCSLGMT